MGVGAKKSFAFGGFGIGSIAGRKRRGRETKAGKEAGDGGGGRRRRSERGFEDGISFLEKFVVVVQSTAHHTDRHEQFETSEGEAGKAGRATGATGATRTTRATAAFVECDSDCGAEKEDDFVVWEEIGKI